MSSDLNFNVKGNLPLPQGAPEAESTTGTGAAVKTDQTAYHSIQKDSVNQSEQPQIPLNLAAYVANTSRPVLPKPVETTLKKQEANRDVKGENEAGTLAMGESGDHTIQEEQPVTQQAVEEKQKKQDDQDQGGQGGTGGGDGGRGESEFVQKSLGEIVATLSQMEKEGKVESFDSDQIGALLNNYGKGEAKRKVADTGAAAPAEGAEEPYPELKINGNTITGPNGTYTIPEPQSPPKTPADLMTNIYHQMKASASSIQGMIDQLPDSPDKLSLANFLKTVLSALTKFQEFLYIMNNIDSKTIREKSKAQLETSLHKLEEQRKAQEEQARKAREAGEKGGVLGVIGKVFGAVGISMSFVLVVVSVVLMCTGVGVGASVALLAVTIPFLIVSIASMITTQVTGKGVFERAFEGIGKLVSALLSAIGINGEANEWITLIVKILVVVLVSVMVAASNPLIFVFGGVSNVIGFITESGVINGFVEKCGGDEKAQMITTIVVTATIMLATMVVSIAMMFIPGAQGALLGSIGSAVTNVTRVVSSALMMALRTVLQVSEKVAETATKIIMAMLKFIINPGFWMTVTMVGMQTAATVNKVKMHELLADIAMLQGEMTKMIEAADALIAIFKKIIQKLLESLTQTGTFISQTSDLIKKIVSGQSESISNLWSA